MIDFIPLSVMLLVVGLFTAWITYQKRMYLDIYTIRTLAGASIACLLLSVLAFLVSVI